MKIGRRKPIDAEKIYVRFTCNLEEPDVLHMQREIERLKSSELHETTEVELYKSATSISIDLSKWLLPYDGFWLHFRLIKPNCDSNDCDGRPPYRIIVIQGYFAILLIASSRKTHNSQSLESRNQNPTNDIVHV